MQSPPQICIQALVKRYKRFWPKFGQKSKKKFQIYTKWPFPDQESHVLRFPPRFREKIGCFNTFSTKKSKKVEKLQFFDIFLKNCHFSNFGQIWAKTACTALQALVCIFLVGIAKYCGKCLLRFNSLSIGPKASSILPKKEKCINFWLFWPLKSRNSKFGQNDHFRTKKAMFWDFHRDSERKLDVLIHFQQKSQKKLKNFNFLTFCWKMVIFRFLAKFCPKPLVPRYKRFLQKILVGIKRIMLGLSGLFLVLKSGKYRSRTSSWHFWLTKNDKFCTKKVVTKGGYVIYIISNSKVHGQ